jgi:AcrR family transcriptional regulator
MANIREALMETRKQDRRVVKTKRAIHMAFASLLSEKDLNDITVRDIADLADINRKTFYNYYSGVYAVLDEIENEVVSTLENALGATDFREAMSHPDLVFEKLTAIINTDLDFYGHLLSMQGNVSLITKTVKLLKQKTREAVLLQLPIREEEIDILLDYTFSGMLTVYQQWFNSDRSRSIEEISETLSELCFNGLNGVLAFPAGQAVRKEPSGRA